MHAAVFVDAGYLYAAGSKLLSGSNLPRSSVQLDADAALAALRGTIDTASPSRLLRIYWYDGVPRTGPTAKQEHLADSDDVKLRLGVIAYTGKQKGVDSLIVTDLIELARNHAISDAVLLSGDEDVRIGVQIAQTYGVRVHLLGIQPASDNQSRLLRQESDTTAEWQRSDLEAFLTVHPPCAVEDTEQRGTTQQPPVSTKQLDSAAERFVRALSVGELAALEELQPRDSIPSELDRVLLRSGADELGRYLESGERAHVRQAVKRLAAKRSTPHEDAKSLQAGRGQEADRIRQFAAER